MAIPKNSVFMKNPPMKKTGTRPSKYEPVAEACRRHPGMWTIFNNNVTSGIITAFKNQFPGFEFTSRANDGQNKKVTVYGRFVGKVDLELQALLDEE